jgi:glucosamine--fructose-6-phosphate aminotransferase (isomerizing)
MSIMLSEIAEQPQALARTLDAERAHVRKLGRSLAARPPRLIILVARGSSDNAALFGRYLIEISTGIPVSLSAPSVHTLYKRRLKLEDTLVIGVSQSGEGADVNLVLESCRKAGARVLAITNEARSSMAGLADETFVTRAGKEKSVAATKTYTCQLMIFYMLACALAGEDCAQLDVIPGYASAAAGLGGDIDAFIDRYRFAKHGVVVGRGLNYATAYEIGIKLMETCYLVMDRFSAADFLHGPIAMLEADFPVFLLAPPGPTFADMKKMAEKVRERHADCLVLSSEPSILKLGTLGLRMPAKIPDRFSPIPYVIPGQILAAKLSALKGLSPDQPRGLTKVTHTI